MPRSEASASKGLTQTSGARAVPPRIPSQDSQREEAYLWRPHGNRPSVGEISRPSQFLIVVNIRFRGSGRGQELRSDGLADFRDGGAASSDGSAPSLRGGRQPGSPSTASPPPTQCDWRRSSVHPCMRITSHYSCLSDRMHNNDISPQAGARSMSDMPGKGRYFFQGDPACTS